LATHRQHPLVDVRYGATVARRLATSLQVVQPFLLALVGYFLAVLHDRAHGEEAVW
jgi:hypothetical protein